MLWYHRPQYDCEFRANCYLLDDEAMVPLILLHRHREGDVHLKRVTTTERFGLAALRSLCGTI